MSGKDCIAGRAEFEVCKQDGGDCYGAKGVEGAEECVVAEDECVEGREVEVIG